MNQRLTELYRSCRTKEALASQDAYSSADVLIGTEVAKFAELIVQECMRICDEVQDKYGQYTFTARVCKERFAEHFGVDA